VEERGKLGLPSLVRPQPERPGDVDGELDDLAAVEARVGVVDSTTSPSRNAVRW